jgi:hypothetical protein
VAKRPPQDRVNKEAFWADYLERLVVKAISKDRDAACQLIGEYVAAVEEGRKPHPVLNRYFAEALNRILGGEDANEALNLKSPSHRPAGERRDRGIQLAAAFRLRQQAGVPAGRAKDEVGHLYGTSSKTIERALLEHPELESLLPAELAALALEGRARQKVVDFLSAA